MAAVPGVSLGPTACLVSKQTGREERGKHGEEDAGTEVWVVRRGQDCDQDRRAVSVLISQVSGDRRESGRPWPSIAVWALAGRPKQQPGALAEPSWSQPQVSGPLCPHLQQDKARCPHLLWEGSHCQYCSQNGRTLLPHKLAALRHYDLRPQCDSSWKTGVGGCSLWEESWGWG